MEFGAKGFDGASTRSIARRADAHQPQINYHFASKEALWAAAVDHLFARLGAALGNLPLPDGADDPVELAAACLARFGDARAGEAGLRRVRELSAPAAVAARLATLYGE